MFLFLIDRNLNIAIVNHSYVINSQEKGTSVVGAGDRRKSQEETLFTYFPEDLGKLR